MRKRLLAYEWIIVLIGAMAIFAIAGLPIYLFNDYNVQSANYVYKSTGSTSPAAGKYLVNGVDVVVDFDIEQIGTGNSAINARIMRAGYDQDFAPIMDLVFTQAPVRVEVPVYEPMAYIAVGLANASAYTMAVTPNKATVKLDSYNPK